MAAGNTVTLVGNLTDDPELRYTPQGSAVANFRIAVNNRFKDQSGNWQDGETSYFRINCCRQLAENIAGSPTRGTRVVVTCRLKFRQWETQEGEKRSVVEIEAEEVGPSLKFATAKVNKAARSENGNGGGGDWDSAGVPLEEEVPI